MNTAAILVKVREAAFIRWVFWFAGSLCLIA
jgi:hypothetical protein